MSPSKPDLVLLEEVATPTDAHVVAGLLRAGGIQVAIRERAPFENWLQVMPLNLALLVPAPQLETAIEVLSAARAVAADDLTQQAETAIADEPESVPRSRCRTLMWRAVLLPSYVLALSALGVLLLGLFGMAMNWLVDVLIARA